MTRGSLLQPPLDLGQPPFKLLDDLNQIILQETTLQDAANSGDLQVDGDLDAVTELLSLLVDFEFWFNIVTP